jgi:hypothetical protein
MTNDLLCDLRKLHSEIVESDGHECEMMALVRRGAAEITQLRGNLSLAEDGLAAAMQEIELLLSRLEGSQAAAVVGEREIERLQRDLRNARESIGGLTQALERLTLENQCLRACLSQGSDELSEQLRVCPKCNRNWISGKEACDCEPSESPQAPIAKLIIPDGVSGGAPLQVEMYAPGLPPGEHDLYCEPEAVAPYMRAEPCASPAERRWSLLTHILDESAETGELPSGLHEAFQLGGDAMAEWLDRRGAVPPQAREWHFDRYRDGQLMAEGVVVSKKATLKEALEWARCQYPPFTDVFKLRDEGPTRVTVGCSQCTATVSLPQRDGRVEIAALGPWYFSTPTGWRCPAHAPAQRT